MFDPNVVVNGIGGGELALTLQRIAVGAFFAFSGFHKLVNQARHNSFVQTLKNDHVPFLKFNEWWVPGWEFFGGFALAVGYGTAFAAMVLCIICVVACLSEAKMRIAQYKPIDKLDWWDDLLYLPEVLYILMLLPFVAMGGGAFSVDRLIGG